MPHAVLLARPTQLQQRRRAVVVRYRTDAGTEKVSRQSETTDDVQLDWRRQWYPVAAIADLPVDRPRAIVILGKNLVTWKDGDGEWRVFEDKCPHRQVALSEGRLEKDGTLMCSYHGWRFNGMGKCTAIPQLEKDREAKVCARPAACAVSFPTASHDGLLWVWMTSGADAHLEAAATPVPCNSNSDAYLTSPWYTRDMEMSWEVLLENVTDPSHVPFSHHGIQGDRYQPNADMYYYKKVVPRGVDGYSVEGAWTTNERTGKVTRTRVDLAKFPTSYNMEFWRAANPEADPKDWKDGPTEFASLLTRAVPVTKTTSRVHVRLQAPGFSKTSIPGRVLKFQPTWMRHLEHNAVLDGDAVFLHNQSQQLLQGKLDPKSYFTPSTSDRSVNEFWKFLRTHARDGINFYPDALQAGAEASTLPRERVLDRYEQHTKHCKACSGALANIRLALKAIPVVMAAAFLAWATVLGRAAALTSGQSLGSALVLAGALVAHNLLQRLERRFVYTDYVHADRK